jgi:hypothetical protein
MNSLAGKRMLEQCLAFMKRAFALKLKKISVIEESLRLDDRDE